MKKVYLDNASTTAVRPEVVEEMLSVLTNDYGNPSSTHSVGRHSKSIIELSRKTIAKNLNCSASEIIFTSGGTEANNWILQSAVKDLKVKRIITSKIEHHAVLYVVQQLQKEYNIQIDYVKINSDSSVDLTHLSELLTQDIYTLVSLMHVNNEIGTVLDINRVGLICKEHHALFHSDTVQSIGKLEIDLQNCPIDFIVASAHKFHGPKGIGFAFIRKNIAIQPLFYGGEQEKGFRSGTEPTHQIAGMAKALAISYDNLKEERKIVSNLKDYLIKQLQLNIPNFKINGSVDGFYKILNFSLPFSEEKAQMLLFNLDMKGIAISRGSACQSGSIQTSHVLMEILSSEELKKPSLRVSFSHFNTIEDIDYFMESLISLM